MELVAAAALFLLWECAVRAPAGALVLAAPVSRVRVLAGAGWRMRSPLPSAPGLLALRPALVLENGGAQKRVDDALVRASLSLERARDALASFRGATRRLARLCDAYALVLFGAAPVLLVLDYEDRVLLALLPLLGVLHVAGVALVFRAHRRIAPAARSTRFDLVLSSALFPPALLAAPKALLAEAFAGVHPIAAAAVLLAPRDFAAFARRERARLESAARSAPAAALERDGLDAICAGLDLDLAAPPPRADPHAASYCPRCWSDFRSGFDACADCEVETVAYPSQGA